MTITVTKPIPLYSAAAGGAWVAPVDVGGGYEESQKELDAGILKAAKETAEREGRNPATGATVTITASKKLTFAPAKAVKDALKA